MGLGGSMTTDIYRIECEECDNVTQLFNVYASTVPEFCPQCGRRQEPEHIEQHDDDDDDD